MTIKGVSNRGLLMELTNQKSTGYLAGKAFASANEFFELTPKQQPILLPQIQNYMDYRKFLSDFYLFKRDSTKNDLRPYSPAMFSAAADIKSPNYLKMVIDGKRNLSADMISKFAKATQMNKVESQDFRWLVMYNQATEPSERNILLKALSDHRVESQLKSGEIDRKTWDKVPSWIAWILYAMIDQADVKFEAESLRSLLRNKASVDEIAQALKSLTDSGEVKMDESTGRLVKARQLIESPEDIPVALVRKLQSQLMYLGMESLFQDGPTEREFGSATLSLTQAEFEELRFKLRQLRKAAQKETAVKRAGQMGDRVYQLNLQLYPVTNKS